MRRFENIYEHNAINVYSLWMTLCWLVHYYSRSLENYWVNGNPFDLCKCNVSGSTPLSASNRHTQCSARINSKFIIDENMSWGRSIKYISLQIHSRWATTKKKKVPLKFFRTNYSDHFMNFNFCNKFQKVKIEFNFRLNNSDKLAVQQKKNWMQKWI